MPQVSCDWSTTVQEPVAGSPTCWSGAHGPSVEEVTGADLTDATLNGVVSGGITPGEQDLGNTQRLEGHWWILHPGVNHKELWGVR